MPKRNDVPDFKKIKQKVGGKKVDAKATNVSVHTKRIRIQEQSIMRDSGEVLNTRNKSLSDLVGELSHYNGNIRKDALFGVKDLFDQNRELYATSTSVFINKTIPLIIDIDIGVRQALVTVYSGMLPQFASASLDTFSRIICVHINNGLTSMNQSIKRTGLYMIQAIIRVRPSLLKESFVKLLSNVVKLTTMVKVTTGSTKGILASTRAQVKGKLREQRPINELAIETIDLLLKCSLMNTTVYDALNDWCDTKEEDSETPVELKGNETLVIPLRLTIKNPKCMMLSTASSSRNEEEELLVSSAQLLLSSLFATLVELTPESVPSMGSRVSSSVVNQQSLSRLLLLAETITNSLLILKQYHVSELTGKGRKDWISLLCDLYPVHIMDQFRNDVDTKETVQQVNSLLVLIIAMLGDLSKDKLLHLIHSEISDTILNVTKKDQWSVLTETLILKVEIIYVLLDFHYYNEDKDQINQCIQYVCDYWKEVNEKELYLFSTPFISFFYYMSTKHPLDVPDLFPSLLIDTLSGLPYSEKSSKAILIWTMGCKLLLGYAKSHIVDEEIITKIASLCLKNESGRCLFYGLPSAIQMTLIAILSYCGRLSDEIRGKLPDVTSLSTFSQITKSVISNSSI